MTLARLDTEGEAPGCPGDANANGAATFADPDIGLDTFGFTR